MSYLTEVLGNPVLDSTRKRIGTLIDLVAAPAEPFPEVVAVRVLYKKDKRLIPWSQFAEVDSEWRLTATLDAITDYEMRPGEVMLDRDVMDKQIVDVHGARVVRVCDLNLVMAHGIMRLIGVDVGFRGLLRRLHLENGMEWIAQRFGWVLHTHVISWADVERLEERRGRLQFRVPADRLSRLHHADIADIVAQLDPMERRAVFDSLDVETAADALEEMEPEVQVSIIEGMEKERAADIVEEMEPDDAADLMADLSKETREELLGEMQPEEAADVKDLMTYHEESAGGIMTTGYVAVPPNYLVKQVFEQLRSEANEVEMIYYLYVVNDEECLVGVFSLRSLLTASPDSSIMDLLEKDIISVNPGTSLEEVAHIITKYDLLAVPVVDEDNRLHGVVTVDDVMDLIVPPTWSSRPPRIFGKS